MNIYYTLKGAHIHMRIFMDGAKCGDLVVREEEWDHFKSYLAADVKLIRNTL